MFCPRCGQKQLLEIARFCFNCGFSLTELKHLVDKNESAISAGETNHRQQDLETDRIAFRVPTPIEEIEKGMILATLSKTRDNKTRTAELLGISLKTLHNKLSLYRQR